MEEPIITNIPIEEEEEKPKKSWLKYSLLLAGVLTVPGSYYAWNYYLSPEAREARSFYAGVEAFEEVFKKLESDTYGGDTPQETIDMFIVALEKGDLELAAKYFKRRIDGEEDPVILENIKKLDAEGRLPEVINDLRRAKMNGNIELSTATYDVFNEGGELKYQFMLFKGAKTPVWKIEAL